MKVNIYNKQATNPCFWISKRFHWCCNYCHDNGGERKVWNDAVARWRIGKLSEVEFYHLCWWEPTWTSMTRFLMSHWWDFVWSELHLPQCGWNINLNHNTYIYANIFYLHAWYLWLYVINLTLHNMPFYLYLKQIKVHVECMEDALLHAISSGSLNIVRIVVDHPRYIADGGQVNRNSTNNTICFPILILHNYSSIP